MPVFTLLAKAVVKCDTDIWKWSDRQNKDRRCRNENYKTLNNIHIFRWNSSTLFIDSVPTTTVI